MQQNPKSSTYVPILQRFIGNISPKVVRFLRNVGLDVLDVKEQHWYGQNDEVLLDIAYRDQRFVLTHHSDFGTLAVNKGETVFWHFVFETQEEKWCQILICDYLKSVNH